MVQHHPSYHNNVIISDQDRCWSTFWSLAEKHSCSAHLGCNWNSGAMAMVEATDHHHGRVLTYTPNIKKVKSIHMLWMDRHICHHVITRTDKIFELTPLGPMLGCWQTYSMVLYDCWGSMLSPQKKVPTTFQTLIKNKIISFIACYAEWSHEESHIHHHFGVTKTNQHHVGLVLKFGWNVRFTPGLLMVPDLAINRYNFYYVLK